MKGKLENLRSQLAAGRASVGDQSGFGVCMGNDSHAWGSFHTEDVLPRTTELPLSKGAESSCPSQHSREHRACLSCLGSPWEFSATPSQTTNLKNGSKFLTPL